MPRLSRWFIRASLAYLIAGFSLGAVMLVAKAIGDYRSIAVMLGAHIECLLIGWTMQLTMGVAFWILPLLEGGVTRGAVWPAWLAFILLNAGVLLVAVSGVARTGALLGRAAEAAAAIAFAFHAWRRIRSASLGRVI